MSDNPLQFQRAPWMAQGACAGVDVAVFFPHDSGGTARAKSICATCIVSAACLQYALDKSERYRRNHRYQAAHGVPAGSNATHGTVYAYNHGCRCLLCRLAKAADRRDRKWSAA
jgi:hypothetical protein